MRKSNHNMKKENPALTRAKIEAGIKKSIDDAKLRGIEFSMLCNRLFSYMVLSDKFGFDHDQLVRFREELNDIGDSLYKEYITVEDILQVCMDEYKLKFDFEELKLIDPMFTMFKEEIVDDEKIAEPS